MSPIEYSSRMQFRPFAPDIEVRGHGVSFITAGFRIVPSVGMRFLVKHGVLPAGAPLDVNAWYSQARWLAAFEDIAREVGPTVLFEIGRAMGEQVPTPPQMQDVRSALRFLDLGYHSYHRRGGRPMLDEATGTMLEGIGHYGADEVPGKREVVSVCANPYPCPFDHGLLTGLLGRFSGDVRVAHDDRQPCRQRGADSCTYRIRW